MPGFLPLPRKRLVPVVEIITGRGIKRPSPPDSPTRTAAEHPPMKRGKMRDRGESPVASSVQEVLSQPVSPTVSDYIPGFNNSFVRGPSTDNDATYPSSSKVSRLQSEPVSLSEAHLTEEDLTPYVYEFAEDEIEESLDLEVPGEFSLEDCDSEYESDDEVVPVRLLDDFTVYDFTTNKVTPASLLSLCSSRSYGASGIVRRWVEEKGDLSDDEVEEDDDADQAILRSKLNRVQLTRIKEFNVHHSTCRPNNTSLDGKIYIRTSHAWYILGIPAIKYSPYFVPFWRNHRITHLLLSSILRDPTIEEASFCKALPDLDAEDQQVSTAPDILGRELGEYDYNAEEVQAYLLSAILELRDDLQVTRASIVRKLTAWSTPKKESFSTDRKLKAEKTRAKVSDRGKGLELKDRDHRKNQTKTFTTPTVSRISHNLFEVQMEASKAPTIEPYSPTEDVMEQAHKYDTDQIRWGKVMTGKEKQYLEVYIEDTTYEINDVVMVLADASYGGKHNFGRTTNEYGNKMWFCQIKYFFEESGEKKFHGQWYLHGSKTVLHELAHPQALYPINMCDDNYVNCIYTKCKFQLLGQADREPGENSDFLVNDFHCGLFYHHDLAEFVDFPIPFLDSLDRAGICSSCEFKVEEDIKCIPIICKEGLTYGGVQYHVQDFVYLIPTTDTKLLLIGQILKIYAKSDHEISLSIHFHKRHSDLEKLERVEPFCNPNNLGLFIDERRLILTSDETEIAECSPLFLSGHCHVRQLSNPDEIEEWIRHDDHFFVKDVLLENGQPRRLKPGELKFCSVCAQMRKKKLGDQEEFMEKTNKLVGLELFCGAGGLGYGMELSGFVETKYAVEFSASAALTYKKNHPHATVCCQDTNTLLRHVVARDSGQNSAPLKTMDGKVCPEMPKKGDQIDLIFGGPPCQAFSRMNHSRRADDIRSTMPCNMLSYVEYYEPKYFLLENVAGLLDYKLTDNRHPGANASYGSNKVQYGMVKLILRTLIALGYQVRYKLLQAVQYGVPQSRTRLIFLGAKRGLTLPEFPVPVYAFPRGVTRVSMPTGEEGKLMKIPPPSRWKSKKAGGKHDKLFHQCAPYEMTSVFGAIGDLPAFDWKNPGVIYKPSTPRGNAKVKNAKEEDRTTWFGEEILEVDATAVNKKMNTPVGYPEGARYATEPQNRYQKWLRKEMCQDDAAKKAKGKGRGDARDVDNSKTLVKYHYTSQFGLRQVEATTTVPLFAGAFHVNLPQALWPHSALPGRKQVGKAFFGRVDGDQYFKCAMTKMAPNIKQAWPLHPLQRRIYTVRECARAQGFPDHYEFCSAWDMDKEPAKVVADQIKQIGNAVAVPLALALGKEIGEARIADCKAEEQREDSVEI